MYDAKQYICRYIHVEDGQSFRFDLTENLCRERKLFCKNLGFSEFITKNNKIKTHLK